MALPLRVQHMPYTSYLDAAQHHGAAGSPHVARDVRLYIIRTWCSVSKTRKKKKMLTFVVYKNKKYLIKEFNLLFPPITTYK
jgi:hypothetical protein